MTTQHLDVARCLELEREARAAAASSASDFDRDDHVMRAERFADHAWHLEEEGEGDYHPSGLWN